MNEWHELTKKIYRDGDHHMDSIIREYLEEKAKEIFSREVRLTITPQECMAQIKEILGLSEQKLDKPEPQKEVWWQCLCKRMVMMRISVGDCGKPRPQPKSLRDTLAEKLFEDMYGYPMHKDSDKAYWYKLADTAIRILEGERKP